MPLYSLITPFTSLFFHIVTFSIEALVWAGLPFLKTLSTEGGILTMQPCLHLMVDIIMWFESLGTKMFFHVGEGMEIPSFIHGNDLLQEILTIIIKVEEMSEGCTHTVFLLVLWHLSRDPSAAHFSVPWTFVNNVPDCAMWKIKLFFQTL